MDTMETTKIVAGICGALLVFLGVKYFIAEPLYRSGEHGETQLAWSLELPEQAPAPAEEKAPVDFAALIAAADPAKGEAEFRKCATCHKTEAGANATGPTLHAVVGRPVGSVPGFNYSSAMAGHGGEWTPEALAQFLMNPKKYVPGTKMSFAGFKKPEEAAAMVAYLATLK
ncbi:MAG: cytochrome c family protein [Alphaproteobacteria bacterium]|nr:MAG: cytochrome c family protein [Alphaproteobacteria bacterium]